MKNNLKIADWLFKPFQFIAGLKALILGIIIMLLLSILGYIGNTHFNGVIGMQYASGSGSTPYIVHAAYQVIALFSMAITFYITARIISKSSVRLIDIAGTMALSQAPHILFGLIGLAPSVHPEFKNIDTTNVAEIMSFLQENIAMMAVVGITTIIILIWSITLKYNAYSVSANIKGIIGGISFTIALIISEILSKILIYIIVPHLY